MKSNKFSGMRRFWRVLTLFLGIFWAFYKLKFQKIWHSKSWVENKRIQLYATQAHKFRTTAVDMGGLLIKLGQFFSTRVDIFPGNVIQELEGLQDEVKAEAFHDIVRVIEEEFGRSLAEIFALIDEKPIASASLGQVHRGQLGDGQEVAIKILRPGIEDLVKTDLRAVRQVVNIINTFTDWNQLIDIDTVYQEFAQTISKELNYIDEGQHAETIARNNEESKELLIPGIFWDYTTQRVLTMEFMHGIKVTDYDVIQKEGINRHVIAQVLLKTYCQQILVDGFFHADPHPGNLFVTKDNCLIMVDFGMVGSISEQLKKQLIQMALDLVKRDYIQVSNHLISMGFLRANANTAVVARAIGVVLEQVLGAGKSISDKELMNLLDDIAQLVYEQPFQIPGSFTFLGRALGTLYGLCLGLDPSINFLEEIKPYLKQFMGDKKGIIDGLWEQGTETVKALVEAPLLAAKVLRRVDQGELNLRVPMGPVIEAVQQNTRAVNALAWALTFGFSLMTSAYLLVNKLLYIAYIGFGFSCIILLVLLSRTGNSHRRRPHPPIIARK